MADSNIIFVKEIIMGYPNTADQPINVSLSKDVAKLLQPYYVIEEILINPATGEEDAGGTSITPPQNLYAQSMDVNTLNKESVLFEYDNNSQIRISSDTEMSLVSAGKIKPIVH